MKWDSTTKADIERLRYLRNPRTAAVYLGLPQTQIEDVWAEMSQRDPLPTAWMDDRHGTGLNSHLVAEEDARVGSQILLYALQAHFCKWEQEHGFREGAGQLLLPAGYRP